MGSSLVESAVSQGDTQAQSHLDTSGAIPLPLGNPAGIVTWDRLTPFAQGYVEALFASIHDPIWGRALFYPNAGRSAFKYVRFSDLAPETLARIMEDCAAREAAYETAGSPAVHRIEGGNFWRASDRSSYLGGDGLIYLREVGQ